MAAYIIRRLLLMVPTLLGIMVINFAIVQFAPGGPIEQIIAEVTGTDAGTTGRISGAGSEVSGGSSAAASQAELLKKIAEANVPNVIIADYHLDGENGLDVIAAVRARLDPQMDAILITADRSAELRADAAGKEVHLLNKPLKPAALRALRISSSSA